MRKSLAIIVLLLFGFNTMEAAVGAFSRCTADVKRCCCQQAGSDRDMVKPAAATCCCTPSNAGHCRIAGTEPSSSEPFILTAIRASHDVPGDGEALVRAAIPVPRKSGWAFRVYHQPKARSAPIYIQLSTLLC